MQSVFLVAVGGAVGALGRWGISRAAYALFGGGFPYGTLVANVLGCFALGFIMHISLATDRIGPNMRLALGVGVMGALTTFSTFSYETVRLLEEAAWAGALANISLNVVLGLAGTLAGLALAKVLFGGAG